MGCDWYIFGLGWFIVSWITDTKKTGLLFILLVSRIEVKIHPHTNFSIVFSVANVINKNRVMEDKHYVDGKSIFWHNATILKLVCGYTKPTTSRRSIIKTYLDPDSISGFSTASQKPFPSMERVFASQCEHCEIPSVARNEAVDPA